jgi:hypothetical protein
MPTRINNAVAVQGTAYASPFVGPAGHTIAIPVLISGLTTAEVDSKGYLKPGVPLLRSGALVSGAGQLVFGVTVEEIKVANGNAGADLTAAGTVEVTVAKIGTVNRAIAEYNLGRVYSANELSAMAAAGSLIAVLS